MFYFCTKVYNANYKHDSSFLKSATPKVPKQVIFGHKFLHEKLCFKKFDCANFKFHTCNHARLGKSWNEFNFFQARKIDLWNKTKAAIEIIRIGILIKVLEEIEVWIGTKFLMEIKWTEKIISMILNVKPRRRSNIPPLPQTSDQRLEQRFRFASNS